MGEKTKVPFISDTVEIDGIFYVEHRSSETLDRRKKQSRRVFYERRSQPDPRTQNIKHIEEEV